MLKSTSLVHATSVICKLIDSAMSWFSMSFICFWNHLSNAEISRESLQRTTFQTTQFTFIFKVLTLKLCFTFCIMERFSLKFATLFTTFSFGFLNFIERNLHKVQSCLYRDYNRWVLSAHA